ncbi:TPA: toxin-antitoxin system HicB family antitoxin [Serratia marcescens]
MKSVMHNPEEYTISVRKELMDGMSLWVARVAELPDILEFGEDMASAYDSAFHTIRVSQEMCLEQGTPFPAPSNFSIPDCTGRITLRLKKSTHAKAIKLAETEGVSLNSYIAACVERENVLKEIGTLESKVDYLSRLVSGMNDGQAMTFTMMSKFVKTHAVTMRSQVKFDVEEQVFNPKANVHRFLLQQDMKYAYD